MMLRAGKGRRHAGGVSTAATSEPLRQSSQAGKPRDRRRELSRVCLLKLVHGTRADRRSPAMESSTKRQAETAHRERCSAPIDFAKAFKGEL